MWPACGAETIIATNSDCDAAARVICVLHSNQFLISFCDSQPPSKYTSKFGAVRRSLTMINDIELGEAEVA